MSTSNRELIEAELDTVITSLAEREDAVREADAVLRGLRVGTAEVRDRARNLRMALFALDGEDKTRADADAAIDDALSAARDQEV